MEAKRVVASNLRWVRSDQPLAHERGKPRRHLGVTRRKYLNGAVVEDLAFDRAQLEDGPLGRLELVEPRREQCAESRRDTQVAVRFAGHGQHLLDEERIAARGVGDPSAHIRGEALDDELVDLGVVERPDPKSNGPCGTAIRELGPGQAQQEDRRVGGKKRDVLDQVEERPSPHWMSSKTTTRGACSSSSLRTAQAISSADVGASVSPRSDPIAAAAASSEGKTPSCLRLSTTGQ